MKNILFLLFFILLSIFLNTINAFAHCEIPCGIYDDEMRIETMKENIETIEKSMNQIIVLEKSNPVNYNQLIRWIMNKEHHADELQEIICQYFMTQRISPDSKKYSQKLELLHRMLINSMKCKQTTDLKYVEILRALVKDFHSLYFSE